MQAKGLVRFFSIALTIVCLFQLSFTLRSYQVEKEATDYAESFRPLCDQGDHSCIDSANLVVKDLRQSFIDSVANITVYNLLLKKYTFDEVRDNRLNLGLDLQGGMSVILQVSVEDILKSLAGSNVNDSHFRRTLAQAKQMERQGQGDFIDLFINAFTQVDPTADLRSVFANYQNRDLISLDMPVEEVEEVLRNEANKAIDRTYQILKSRIDKFGVASPYIAKLEGSDRIIVELPGADDPARVRKYLQSTAKLEFWEVFFPSEVYQDFVEADQKIAQLLGYDEESSEGDGTEDSLNLPDPIEDTLSSANDTFNVEDLEDDTISFEEFRPDFEGSDTAAFDPVDFTSTNPLLARLRFSTQQQTGWIGAVEAKDTGKVRQFLRMEEVQSSFRDDMKLLWGNKPDEESGLYLLYAIKKNALDDKAPLEGDVITTAFQDYDDRGFPAISMRMNTRGANIWERLTENNVNRYIAIALDNQIYSAPVVNEKIGGGSSIIRGQFSIKEAQDLANILEAGKLPAPAKIVQESQVGPTLGKESIRSGVLSLIAGMLLVLVFMIAYYNGAGLVADLVLIVNIFFIFGVLASLGATLTLPGIAGIVLTIGMAVDANVIIFERVREEILKGKGIRLALVDGYKNSYSAIIDANVTTLITAIILFYFGMGPVLGFATVLIIGIFSSLFTAVLLSRLVFNGRIKKDKNISYGNRLTMTAFSNINLNFLGKRKIAYVVSGIIILIGVASFYTKGFELGVDFKGGRSYDVRFQQEVTVSEVKAQLTEVFGQSPVVKAVSFSTQLKITTSYMIDSSGTDVDSLVQTRLFEGLKPYLGDITYQTFDKDYKLSYIKVQPTIADDIQRSSIWATVFALIGIFVYILIRFRKWQFSVGALAALAHDVIIILAIFSIFSGILPFSLEIDQAFIAALLTVIGYSINDTVVVFDRVRELLNEKSKKESSVSVINRAINKTLSRTLITSLTTLMVILVLFLFGSDVIRGFSFAILMGILVGTYSSIFVATPIMTDLSTRKEKIIEEVPSRKSRKKIA